MKLEDIINKNNKEFEKRELKKRTRLMELWNNLKPFKTPNDVPDIPIVDKDEYAAFYIPKLIKAGAIRRADLINGQIYIGKHRRCTVAKWNENIEKFEYWRNKFGYWFIDTCNHFENDNGFALFVPIKLGTEQDFMHPNK